jgi:hypothetical protein
MMIQPGLSGSAEYRVPSTEPPALHSVPGTRYSGLSVIEVDPESDACWQAFVAAHPDALIYHHPAWLRVLGEEK